MKSGDLVKHRRLKLPHRAGFRVDLVGIIVSDDPIGDGLTSVKKVYWFNKGTKPPSVVANEELLLYGADSERR